jgi:3-hydroxyisobutyrate dehydrogenase
MTEQPQKRRVGFAGLGLMGSRMARNVLDKGFPLTVWNRTPARTQAIAARGAQVAPTPRALAESSDVIVACLADPAAVEEVVFGEDGILAGARPELRYMECSTISPGLSRRVADALRSRGADMLEAPVTGSKLGAERGALVFMTGGRLELQEELMPILLAMGSKVIHCGEVGQASVVKLVGNTVISFLLEGLCEGLLVGTRAGVGIDKVLEVVMASGFASPYFTFKGEAIARRDWDTHFSIDLMVKDQTLMLDEAEATRVPMPGLTAIREVFQVARARGWGDEDIVAVFKALEAGIPSDPS